MKMNFYDVAELGGGLVVNGLGTSMVGNNLRWNGNPQTPAEDTVYYDRRLWGGLASTGVMLLAPEGGLFQAAGSVLADGLLNSLVTTEVLRRRATPAPAPQGQLQNPGPQAQPQQATQGDLSGFYK